MIKIRYIVFALLEAIITAGIFPIIYYVFEYEANDNVLIVNFLVWSLIDIFVYFILSVIFRLIKKRIKQVYFIGIASGFLGVIVFCLSRAKSIDEYSFLSLFGFVASLLSVIDIMIKMNEKNIEYMSTNKIPKEIYNKLDDTISIDTKKLIIILVEMYLNRKSFRLSDAAQTLKISERRASKIIKIGMKKDIIEANGNTSSRAYKIIDAND